VAYGGTEDKNAEIYSNGISKGTSSDNYTAPEFGTYFFIGLSKDSSSHLNGLIQSVCCYSRALSATEVAAVTAILNAGGL
jgi:hypothetical protein